MQPAATDRTPVESREDVARREVGHTTIAPRLARAIVACFLAALALLPIADTVGRARGGAAETRPWAGLSRLPAEMAAAMAAVTPTGSIFWDRIVPANRVVLAWFSEFESALEDQSAVGRRLRPPAQMILSGRLGAGNERVYVGHGGWLFYRPDVEYVTGPGFLESSVLARRVAGAAEYERPPQPDPRPAILQFARDLTARGIPLILMPTPVKPSVHPADLSAAMAGADAPVQNTSYAAFVEEMRTSGLLVYDAGPELVAARRSGAAQYLRTDTHWRPEAMQRVAEALAAFIEAHVPLPPVPSTGYRTEPREARQHGDTLAMLDLPPEQTSFPPETVPLRFVLGPDHEPWRPARGADLLVLGDSFTNIYSLPTMGWGEAAGLVEQLSVALDRPVDRIVQNDQGASATRLMLQRQLAAGDDRLAATRVVVWQFSARELAVGDWAVLPMRSPGTP
jgi:hypothetical protein